MLIFNLTIHHLWGRVLVKFQETQSIAYTDDGYFKTKLSVTLRSDVAHNIITTSSALTHLRLEIALDSSCPEGFVGIGVSTGTDTFVRNFVAKTCANIIDEGHPTQIY
jgi:hypothetical protein